MRPTCALHTPPTYTNTYTTYRSVRPDTYYDDPDFNAILKTYSDRHHNASILFPSGGLQCMRSIRNITDDKVQLNQIGL